jgi:hypothetical protein
MSFLNNLKSVVTSDIGRKWVRDIYDTSKSKKQKQIIMLVTGGTIFVLLAKVFFDSSQNRRSRLQTMRNREFYLENQKGKSGNYDLVVKAYDHNLNKWSFAEIPYTDWSGHQAIYKSPKQCIRGLNWFMEPISICPSSNHTFLVTDELTKKMYEDISVRVIGSNRQKLTVVI